jgi:UDP-N-acetylmuramoyl-tripeptide--D-alanyl-D-alanine ligase
MKLSLSQVARAIGASPPRHDGVVSGWSVDTRTLQPGDLFFALRGPRHDGHDYVATAMSRGAIAVVVDHACAGVEALVVTDTLAALQALAAGVRQTWGGTVVGVTGSAGKTTTKDAIAHLLAVALPVGKTIGNLNNHVGVPLSILRLEEQSQVAVLEMGMNHAGEIRALAALARPDIGVVTNVGSAHLEAFASADEVALAKRELIEALPPGGTAVLNADDPRVAAFRSIHRGRTITFGMCACADIRAQEVTSSENWTRFRVGAVEFATPLPGRHSVQNLLAAIAVASVFGIALEQLRDAVSTFSSAKMRGGRMERNGVVIYDDCYNANPEAVRAMLDVLASTPANRRIAVLGEMLELGRAAEDLHRQVGQYVVQRGIDILIAIRGAARYMADAAVQAGLSDGAAYFFEDASTAGDFVRPLVRPGDAVLFKGSRGVQVERALERLLA